MYSGNHATGEWPYTIAKLVGDKALNTAHGKRHFQLRRVMEAAFLAEPTLQYITRTIEIAEAHCQQWAQLQHFSGEHAVKDFAFQVCTSVQLCLSGGSVLTAWPSVVRSHITSESMIFVAKVNMHVLHCLG